MGYLTNILLFAVVFSFLTVTIFSQGAKPDAVLNSTADTYSFGNSTWNTQGANDNLVTQLSGLLYGNVSASTAGLLAAVGLAIGIIFPNPYVVFLGVTTFFAGCYLFVQAEIKNFFTFTTGSSDVFGLSLFITTLLTAIFLMAVLQWHRNGSSGELP